MSFVIGFLIGGVLGCSAAGPAPSGAPSVRIVSPQPGAELAIGRETYVQVGAEDPSGIARLELWVNGALASSLQPPEPQVTYMALIPWVPASPGQHSLRARAFNRSGASSDTTPVQIVVVEGEGSVVTAPQTVPPLQPPPTVPSAQAFASSPPTSTRPASQPTEATRLPDTEPPPPTAIQVTVPPPPTREPTVVEEEPTAPPQLPPALYVVQMRTDPPEVKSKPAKFVFRLTFLNTNPGPVGMNWRVLIYRPDESKAMGDPRGEGANFPPGQSEASTLPWEIKTIACEQFYAKPVRHDEDGRQTPLVGTNGQEYTLSFQVCP